MWEDTGPKQSWRARDEGASPSSAVLSAGYSTESDFLVSHLAEARSELRACSETT